MIAQLRQEDAHGLADDYEAYGCSVNRITVEALFDWYRRLGFLYDEKERLLSPYWEAILHSWKCGIRGGELLHWYSTYQVPESNAWASVSSWRSTQGGWVVQHLVSSNAPAAAAVMLGGIAMRLKYGRDRSHQNWYQPSKKLPKRLFGSITRTVGMDLATVQHYELVEMPLAAPLSASKDIRVVPCDASNQADLLRLARQLRGSVYVAAEELDQGDLMLEAVDSLYGLVGLSRTRRVLMAYEPGREDPVTAAIAYRGPIGLNFSFLENRCDVLVRPELSPRLAERTVGSLLAEVSPIYKDFAPQRIFVATDQRTAAIISDFGGRWLRSYAQAICLAEGMEAWYQHVEAAYARVLRISQRAPTQNVV